MSVDLSGKVALITGAAGGIGNATVEHLTSLGATVIATDVVGDVRRLDVTDAAAWTALVKEVMAEFGGLDIVYLNAGVMLRPPSASVMDDVIPWLEPDKYRRVMAINTDGVFYGLSAVLPALEARGGGDIVVTSSIAGISPLQFDPVYAMSKHALVGLVISLAQPLEQRGIRLNAICPGGINTGIVPDDIKRVAEETLSPPSFIAGVVERVLDSKQTGKLWVAMSAPDNIWQYEPAPLVPPAS